MGSVHVLSHPLSRPSNFPLRVVHSHLCLPEYKYRLNIYTRIAFPVYSLGLLCTQSPTILSSFGASPASWLS